jgi:cation:H+ antiporter
LIGLTIVSIGTSLPEIMTNIFSGLKVAEGIQASGIAIGTNIGSCVTQITLILGIIGLVGIVKASKKLIVRDGFMILFSIVLLFLAGLDGQITRVEGALLVTIYLFYLYVISKDEQVASKIKYEIKNHGKGGNFVIEIIRMLAGLAILIYASHLVVDNAILMSDILGISGSFIGIMIIGVSTGLPEFSTALRGVLAGAPGLSAGTLIGSNITDPLFSQGIGALIAGFTFEQNLLFFDLPFWFIASAFALFLLRKGHKLYKKEAIMLILLYAVFATIKIVFFRF